MFKGEPRAKVSTPSNGLIGNAPLRKAVAQLKAGKKPHQGVQEQLRAMLKKQGGCYYILQQWNLEKECPEDTSPLQIAHSSICAHKKLKRRATRNEVFAAYKAGSLTRAVQAVEEVTANTVVSQPEVKEVNLTEKE